MANFDGTSGRRSPLASTGSTPTVDSRNSVSSPQSVSFSPKNCSHSKDTFNSFDDKHLSSQLNVNPRSAGQSDSTQIGSMPDQQNCTFTTNQHLQRLPTFSKILHSTNIMDVNDIIDDNHNISTNLSSLQIDKNDIDIAPAFAASNTESIVSAPNRSDPLVRQATKRLLVASDDSLIEDFVGNSLQNALSAINDRPKTVSWAEQMEQDDLASKLKMEKDITLYLPENLVPYYSAAQSLLEKRVKSIERLKKIKILQMQWDNFHWVYLPSQSSPRYYTLSHWISLLEYTYSQ